MNTRFVFTGELQTGSGDSFLRTGKTKGGANYKSLNFSIVAAKNNRAFVEIFGMERSTIKGFDTDGNPIEIDWEDRLDEGVIDSMRNKRIVAIGEDREEFITEYDQIDYIVKHIEELRGKMVTVTGQVSKNIYNGKISDRFQVRNLYTVDEDAKPRLRIIGDFYWTKDSLDANDFAEDKKVIFNGYMENYVAEEKGNRYLPQTAILDCTKVDFTSQKHNDLVKFKLGTLGFNIDGMKIAAGPKLKANTYYAMAVEFNYVNGAEQIEFSEDMLTPFQKEQVELGLKTVDDFRPNGSTYGNRVTEYKIYNYDARDEYADGMVVKDKAKDFEELIYTPHAQTVVPEGFSMPEPQTNNEEDDLDLFG